MDHLSNYTSVFIKYHQLVGVRSTDKGPVFYGNPKGGCHNFVCSKCVFNQAGPGTCYVNTSDQAYNPILTHFKTHCPEKLI